jgi:hypothetical protein
MEVGGKIDMFTHSNSLIKNVLDRKHHIEAVVYSLKQLADSTIYSKNGRAIADHAL